jgi:hypothetical protein
VCASVHSAGLALVLPAASGVDPEACASPPGLSARRAVSRHSNYSKEVTKMSVTLKTRKSSNTAVAAEG